VALVGRPSSGKSTFLNRGCGGKGSIVSPVPQTTRNRIRGIHTAAPGQRGFVDTPGFHASQARMNLRLRELALAAVQETDLVLYLVDVTRPPGEEERALCSALRGQERRLGVGLNTIDVPPNHRARAERELAAGLRSPRLFPLSARSGEGLEAVLAALWELAPEGPAFYPPDYYTDQSPEFRIAEIVREKAMQGLREEVPHALYVHVEDLERREAEQELWARCLLYVERDSQKGILVGRGGERIKATRRAAEEELAELFPCAVRLDLRVKVRPKWRRDEALLSRLLR